MHGVGEPGTARRFDPRCLKSRSFGDSMRRLVRLTAY
jgi:hypothetical protein